MRRALLFAALVLTATTDARAERAAVPSRFSLELPAGWTPQRREDHLALLKKNYPKAKQGEAPAPSLFAVGPAEAAFTPFLVVVETPGTIPATEQGRARFAEEQAALVSPLGGRVERAELWRAGERTLLRAETRFSPAGVDTQVVTVLFPMRSGGALVSVFLRGGTLEAQRASLDGSLSTFQSDEPWHRGLFGGRVFTFAVIAVVGAGFFVVLLRRRRAATAPPGPRSPPA